MHIASWRMRKDPGRKRWEWMEGTCPRGSHCRHPHLCDHGWCTDNWLSSQRLRLKPGQSGLQCLSSQSLQSYLPPLPPSQPTSSSDSGDSCPGLGDGKGRITYHWLDKDSEAQGRADQAARHQHQEPGKGEAGREQPPAWLGRNDCTGRFPAKAWMGYGQRDRGRAAGPFGTGSGFGSKAKGEVG